MTLADRIERVKRALEALHALCPSRDDAGEVALYCLAAVVSDLPMSLAFEYVERLRELLTVAYRRRSS